MTADKMVIAKNLKQLNPNFLSIYIKKIGYIIYSPSEISHTHYLNSISNFSGIYKKKIYTFLNTNNF